MHMKRLITILSLTALAVYAAARFIPLYVGDHRIMVEVADDNESRARGLQHRTSISENQGMLFVFPVEGIRYFWMKDVKFPIDIIYLDRNKQVVKIRQNVPPCGREPCAVYDSEHPAMYVLELAADRSAALGIEVGQRLVFHLR